jgi:hypothetical protein
MQASVGHLLPRQGHPIARTKRLAPPAQLSLHTRPHVAPLRGTLTAWQAQRSHQRLPASSGPAETAAGGGSGGSSGGGGSSGDGDKGDGGEGEDNSGNLSRNIWVLVLASATALGLFRVGSKKLKGQQEGLEWLQRMDLQQGTHWLQSRKEWLQSRSQGLLQGKELQRGKDWFQGKLADRRAMRWYPHVVEERFSAWCVVDMHGQAHGLVP